RAARRVALRAPGCRAPDHRDADHARRARPRTATPVANARLSLGARSAVQPLAFVSIVDAGVVEDGAVDVIATVVEDAPPPFSRRAPSAMLATNVSAMSRHTVVQAPGPELLVDSPCERACWAANGKGGAHVHGAGNDHAHVDVHFGMELVRDLGFLRDARQEVVERHEAEV